MSLLIHFLVLLSQIVRQWSGITTEKISSRGVLRVPYTQYGFYLYLHVSEGVPVRKKDEILD